jgi:PAS domain S-box-containing protein
MFIIRKKLLFRLLIITLVSSTIPLVVAGIYVITSSNRGLRTSATDQLSTRILQAGIFIQENLIIPTTNLIDEIEARPSASMPQLLAQYPEIESVVFSVFQFNNAEPFLMTDMLGTTSIAIFSDKVRQKLVSNLTDSPQLSSFTAGSPGPDSAIYLFVVKNTPQNIAMGAVLNLTDFLSGFSDFTQSHGWSNEFALIDFADNQSVLFTSVSDAGAIAQASTVNEAFGARPVNPLELFEHEESGRGTSLAMYWDLPGFAEWRIVAQVPRSVVWSPVKDIWQNFAALLIFGIMLTLMGTIYYWKKITRPLERFARSATEIARGDFNQKVQVDSEDEIGRLARIFNYMVIELRRLNEMNLNKIITEKAKTQTIIKNIADGVVVTDNFDRVVSINSAMEDWFRITEPDVREKPVSMALDAPGLIELLEEIKNAQMEGTQTRELSFLLPGQNKENVFQAKAARIVSHEEKFVGVVTVMRDITREKEIDRMKSELVSLVAHELRSPLASISGFAEILSSIGGTQEQIEEYANIIRQEAERLAELVSKYLDLTKMEAGRMDFRLESISIREVFDSMLYLASAQGGKKNIEIDLNIPDEDCEIYADGKMISEVLLNLLSNAIKYSPAETRVRVDVAENSRGVNITVTDQGFGIAEDHLSHIFDKFYRIKDDPRVQDERGTGLGLSLVKEIVELHGGSIKVESRINRGTKFKILLPKKKPDPVWMP